MVARIDQQINSLDDDFRYIHVLQVSLCSANPNKRIDEYGFELVVVVAMSVVVVDGAVGASSVMLKRRVDRKNSVQVLNLFRDESAVEVYDEPLLMEDSMYRSPLRVI